jgi:hypothetical protein
MYSHYYDYLSGSNIRRAAAIMLLTIIQNNYYEQPRVTTDKYRINYTGHW